MSKNNKTNVIYKDIETGVRYTEIPPGYKIADSKGKEVLINKELLKNKTSDGRLVILPDIVVTAPYKGKLQKKVSISPEDRHLMTTGNTTHFMDTRAADRFVGSEYSAGNLLYTYLIKPTEGFLPSNIWGAATTDEASGIGNRIAYAWNPLNRGFFETNDYTRQLYDNDPLGGTRVLNFLGDLAVPLYLSDIVKGIGAVPKVRMSRSTGNAVVPLVTRFGPTLASSRPVVTRRLANDITSSPTKQYRVGNWLLLVDESSGIESNPDTSWLMGEITKAHKKIRDYYNSSEFKKRVMATGKFTEEEYHKLMNEINELIANNKGVKLRPRPSSKNSNATNITYHDTGYSELEYYTDIPLSKELLISNIYHEFGGHLFSNGAFNLPNLQIDYPMIARLNNYNKSLFRTMPIENFDALYLSEPKMRSLMINTNPDAPISQIDKWAAGEISNQNWYKKEILKKPSEIRARLFTWLNKLKRLGYDTEHATPEELIKWTELAYRNGENMPYDINHIIAVFGNNKDLLSKFLISTGVISTAAALSN